MPLLHSPFNVTFAYDSKNRSASGYNPAPSMVYGNLRFINWHIDAV